MTITTECCMTMAMDGDSLRCARYWRDTLADAELGQGAFRRGETDAFHPISAGALTKGRVDQAIVGKLFGVHADSLESLTVVLRPLVYQSRTSHARHRAGLPAVVTPIVTRATLMRDGRLASFETTVVPRDLLEPLARGEFSVGTMTALDDFLTAQPHPPSRDKNAEGDLSVWDGYRRYCRSLIAAVFPALAQSADFQKVEGGLIALGAQGGASRAIAVLYDQIERDAPAAPLFATFATQPATDPVPCLPEHAGFAARLGHASDRYALADSQRGALTHVLAAEHGEVVAVNGPPGTGKTTLLLSVVASLWVKAALAGGEPPLVFAASTNNQAVTNVIDAFGADFAHGDGPFAGRWLPRIASFGSYFPSGSQRKNAANYLTDAFFDAVEQPDYVEHAQAAYLAAAAEAFPDPTGGSVADVVAALHERLSAQAAMLAQIEGAWKAIVAARAVIAALLGDDPRGALAERQRRADGEAERLSQAERLGERWDRHQAGEPLLYLLFGWLPAIAARRLAAAREAVRSDWPGTLPAWSAFQDISPAIAGEIERARASHADAQASLAAATIAQDAYTAALLRWQTALRPLGIAAENCEAATLAACDPRADCLLRFPMFLTAVHYWEGRWLLDMAAIADPTREKKRKARAVTLARWYRRMKLTPCAVSTFYVLPALMRAVRHEDGEFIGDYLYDLIDLLIVDEAGQVTPEVAGAAFALARSALVIGDTEQIEPIWNVPGRVDVGNLLDNGLIDAADPRGGQQRFAAAGRAASSGSVMRIAQHVSRYHQDPDLARGLVLHEHRRCFDEIIGYCNDLCYAGKLKPLRGPKTAATGEAADGLPAMGHLHVDGLCEALPGGSRHNLAEADTIAAWLNEHRTMLQAAYPGRLLGAIVGIVTPFAGQVRAIRTALAAVDIEAAPGGVTVGSVHAFQGGQRPVMIFSPTYSKHADGKFIDAHASMLNVAVSRAMNSFLVFGDLDCFSVAPPGSPRALLGRRLLADDRNALSFRPVERRDLARRSRIEHLRDAAEHDAFLEAVLAGGHREVYIVTSWLTWHALTEAALVPAMAKAISSGTALTIYTDADFNHARTSRNEAASQSFAKAVSALREAGAALLHVRGVHSKILMAGDDLYCAGSFNWLSAARSGSYERHETSLVYTGPSLSSEIAAMKDSLEQRIARDAR
ncbi:hypothetical protein F4693_001642 [Sphingomonas endophytica]|uniref:Phospholipase D n=1 Tax=Sphingomonas endophytica TaxID=869719 RepID=A0A7X0JCG8_9SPHN|nr:AAA domain-containing protein [Sphingomonas endophytica]MBB6504669.1 hypothetical protein [Sphingomonas endophytica]